MTRAKSGLVVVGLLGVAASISTCERVPLTAPAGSSIFLQANPTSVPANGGRSLVTALVVEPAGTLVPDGTEVLFLTNLGSIDETAKTVDGIARVYFVSDARSGEATVTAMSGGPAASAAPTTTSTTTTTGSASDFRIRASRASSGSAGFTASAGTVAWTGAAAVGMTQATVKITVGAKLPKKVTVGAKPQRITSPRQSTIVANVYDDQGNPVQNVQVIFKIDSVSTGAEFEERLASGGSPRFTDSSGQAFDTLFTTALAGGSQKSVVVSATTSNGVIGTVTVAID